MVQGQVKGQLSLHFGEHPAQGRGRPSGSAGLVKGSVATGS